MSVKDNFPALKPSLLLDFANTKVLDPRITFSRASTATFYDGKTVTKAEENLLTYSQDFSNAAWGKFNGSVAANSTTAPDGTATADTLTEDTSTGGHYLQYAALTLNSAATFSIFVKPNGRTSVIVWFNSVGGGAVFDVSAGTLAGTLGVAPTSTSITSAGNGWYRCSIHYSSVVAVVPIIYLVNTGTNASYTGDGTSGVYLWGAQLEQRSSVTAYTPTTTQPITNYIPVLQTAAANVARFDHNPVTGESLGLRVEEQRTNLLTYSEQFDNASWAKSGCSIIANTIIAPDGTLTADKVVENTANNAHVVNQLKGTIGVAETRTIYAKAAERNWLYLGIGAGSNAYFDLANGVVGSVANGSANISSVGNGWYRCSFTATRATNTNNVTATASANGTITYTGDGYSGIYIWGAQLEAGSFATSYIPTVASQVTRSADSASMTGTNFSSWYRADEGTLYGEVATMFGGATRPMAVVSDGTTNNRIETAACSGSNNAVGRFTVVSNGSVQADSGNPSSGAPIVSANTFYKITGTYKTNDFAWNFIGGATVTDTSGLIPIQSQLSIGGRSDGLNLNGTIKKLAYYPIRCTNSQLQALTQQG